MTTITGNTYAVREQLKALGGLWNADAKGWDVPDRQAAAARQLVESAPPPAPKQPGKCSDCGKSCKEPFTLCWDCKAKRDQRAGKCAKCHERMNEWERKHGMRLCADCRDGGSRARGGASYYDRNGNFVLGEDD